VRHHQGKTRLSGELIGNSEVYAFASSPKRMSLAPCSSPSGPAKAVSVCPQRGVRGSPLNGKTRGLGAGSGDSVSSSMWPAAEDYRVDLQVCCLISKPKTWTGTDRGGGEPGRHP